MTTPSAREQSRLLNIGDGLTMPLEAVTQTFAIVGKRGRGKTATAKVLAEEMIGAGQQVVVMDTVGAWWGLHSSLDGNAPGLPVVVFGGIHGDVPLEETAGAVIARALMSHRVPAVIDLSGFRKAAQRRFATAFIEELYHSNREPMHVIFDEADEFAPQSPMQEGRHLLGAMEDFARRGRLRGLTCTLVSQRPAVIHKDVLTQGMRGSCARPSPPRRSCR
ncbi:helicase HerA domain-containing protein [Gryllotalpicola reticulitermitis]|uniref:Helicase HerA domain-containing protein n=1 Tax=Gryllotalpicola reticulitermitis TaxID=1184153 RepID=A0ABV8Q7H2_9MICO